MRFHQSTFTIAAVRQDFLTLLVSGVCIVYLILTRSNLDQFPSASVLRVLIKTIHSFHFSFTVRQLNEQNLTSIQSPPAHFNKDY